MEQKRVPEAAPQWPSVELGIGEKRSFRKGSMSAFKKRKKPEISLKRGVSPPRVGRVRAVHIYPSFHFDCKQNFYPHERRRARAAER